MSGDPISILLTVTAVVCVLSFVLWMLLAIIALVMYANFSKTHTTDPDYQNKSNDSKNVDRIATIFGWICLISLLFLIFGGVIFSFLPNR